MITCRAMAAPLLAVLLAAPSASASPVPELPSQIPESQRERLQRVTTGATVATRVEGQPFPGRGDVFEFLLDHPEFATHVTRALKLARYRIWRTPDGLHLDDGWGTSGRFELVYAGPGLRVMYARGQYRPRLLPDIPGQAVVIIEYRRHATGPRGDLIAPAVSGFVKIEGRLMAMAGKLVGSIAAAKADKEASRLIKLFAKAMRAIETDPPGVYAQLRERPDVPARDLEEFRQLLQL